MFPFFSCHTGWSANHDEKRKHPNPKQKTKRAPKRKRPRSPVRLLLLQVESAAQRSEHFPLKRVRRNDRARHRLISLLIVVVLFVIVTLIKLLATVKPVKPIRLSLEFSKSAPSIIRVVVSAAPISSPKPTKQSKLPEGAKSKQPNVTTEHVTI